MAPGSAVAASVRQKESWKWHSDPKDFRPPSFGAVVALGDCCSPHSTEKQAEVQKKWCVSAPREILPLAPRRFQAQDLKKKFFFFLTFTFLSWLASTELVDSPPAAPPAEGSGPHLWVLIGPFAQGMSWLLILLPIKRKWGLSVGRCFVFKSRNGV